MRRFLHFMALPASEKGLFLGAAALLLAVRLGLWLLPYRVVSGVLERRVRRRGDEDRFDARVVADAARAVVVAGRYVPRATCLAQALTLRTLLGLLGQPARLRIGVRKNADALEAHAWVESGGRVVIGGMRGLARFTALETPTCTTLP